MHCKNNLCTIITTLKVHSDRAEAKVKAEIFFDVCRLFFDLFRFQSRFRLVWMGPYPSPALELCTAPWVDDPHNRHHAIAKLHDA